MEESQSSKPLISVALCTYNGEKYVKDQLDSILNQTYSNLEVIVLDDASTDRTDIILSEFTDSRMIFFKNDKNLGFNDNFQKCLNMCTGEYISIADQDDIWMPNKIEELYKSIGNSILAYSDSILIDEFSNSLKKTMGETLRIRFRDVSSPLSFLFLNFISGHAMLFKRELLNFSLPIPDGFFYDWWLAFTAAAVGEIRCSELNLVKHRKHNESATSNILRHSDKRSLYKNLVKNLDLFASHEFLKEGDRKKIESLLVLEQQRSQRTFSIELFSFLLENSELLFLRYEKKSKLRLINRCFKESRGI